MNVFVSTRMRRTGVWFVKEVCIQQVIVPVIAESDAKPCIHRTNRIGLPSASSISCKLQFNADNLRRFPFICIYMSEGASMSWENLCIYTYRRAYVCVYMAKVRRYDRGTVKCSVKCFAFSITEMRRYANGRWSSWWMWFFYVVVLKACKRCYHLLWQSLSFGILCAGRLQSELP